MKFRNLVAATAALTMAATPAIAQSAPAERAAAPVAGESDFGGEADGGTIILAILAVAAIIAGIVIAVGGDDNDNPISA